MKEKIVNYAFQGRLDRFLRRYFPYLPQSLIEKHIRKGEVKKNNKRTKSSDRVFENDIVAYPQIFETFVSYENTSLKDPYLYEQFQKLKVFETQEFCVIKKPYNLATQGGSKIKYSLDAMANAGPHQHFLVHRLDKHTTGLLILAKNPITANVFMHQFREKKIQKYYLALIKKRPLKDSGLIDLPLYDAEAKVTVDFEKGKVAKTRYRVLGQYGDVYVILLKPYTGRKHQLRIHLKEGLNTPIIGDEKYEGMHAQRMYLQAYKVKIPGYQPIKIACDFEIENNL